MVPFRRTDVTLLPQFAAMSDDQLAHHLVHRSTVVLPDERTAGEASSVNAARVLAGRFRLIGEEHGLTSWSENPSPDKEWLIALHKHYFLPDLLLAHRSTGETAYLDAFATLLTSWLDEMGSGFDAHSDAQVEAKRLESWVAAFVLLRSTAPTALDPAVLRRWVQRMGDEAAYVAAHLKPVRNHRTFQLSSVFAVGVLFPELTQAAALADVGRRELSANLLTDLLPDGVHVEMSSHYHQLVTQTAVDFVDLARRNAIALDPVLLERVHAALRWAMWMQWPDGSIPLLGDSDDGGQRSLLLRGSELYEDPELRFAATLGAAGRPPSSTSRAFEDSGYLVMSDRWGRDPGEFATRTHVVFDCARLGEGSHSHYDLFSFCLHADGRPAVVDPGRFTYSSTVGQDGVDWRHAFKATRAHNTVTIDDADQTRYLSRTKHGPAVRVERARWHLGDRSDWVVARARSEEYSPAHTRVLVFVRRQYLLVVDLVTCPDRQQHTADLRFHLPAGFEPTLTLDGRQAELVGGPVQLLTWVAPGARAAVEQGWVSTEYGVKTPAPVVSVRGAGDTDMVFASALAPRHVGGEPLSLHSLRRWGPRGFVVDGSVSGVPFTDTVQTAQDPDGGDCEVGDLTADDPALRDLVVGGRFVVVRRAAGGVVHLVGEDVRLGSADAVQEWTHA